MSSSSVPVIRNTLRCCTSHLRSQRRWARVHDVRFVTTHQDPERIVERYKEKLVKKAQEEGHENIASLKQAYKDKISKVRRAATAVPAQEAAAANPSPFQQAPPQPPTPREPPSQTSTSSTAAPSSSAAPGIKPLSSYLDLAKVSALPSKEVEYIWRLRHASDPLSLCAVIPLETYTRIYRTAKRHPQFILPLPRPTADDGNTPSDSSRSAVDIHFLQWGFHPPASNPVPAPPESPSANSHTSTVLFTHLAAYKLHGAYAQPHTTITHHLDLADSHGLVLLNGSVVDGRGISPDEGRWLLMCLQKFYDFEGHGGGVGKEKRQGLLEKFSKGDVEGFKVEDLVDEAERVS